MLRAVHYAVIKSIEIRKKKGTGIYQFEKGEKKAFLKLRVSCAVKQMAYQNSKSALTTHSGSHQKPRILQASLALDHASVKGSTTRKGLDRIRIIGRVAKQKTLLTIRNTHTGSSLNTRLKTMNSALNRKILKENAQSLVCDLKLTCCRVIQQGNNPKPKSNSISKQLKRNKMKVLAWPSQCPDLNYIEMFWQDGKWLIPALLWLL